MGFFIDWLIQFLASAAELLILVVSGLIYVGIFMYIDAMVKDIRMRFRAIDHQFSFNSEKSLNKSRLWSIYVREMEFHTEIIR